MEKLNKARETGGFQSYAYCLMDNHVHLLIKEGEALGISIKQKTRKMLSDWKVHDKRNIGHSGSIPFLDKGEIYDEQDKPRERN
ncbi:hypothetical protein GH808_12480 [Acetobacterium fimetarium]|uniref:Transposase IS200-like domain-containing protein n=1 Tax=Acetobacterium fimetarium TaxID=52691 RepID=A0ABR6WX79_9FIRM|nr:hypothetical protein [Acetobacterium fimetarium]MBC3805234.1 hypothetical protein [Acetobacterium fimetarium]